jgi:hypothetical protein
VTAALVGIIATYGLRRSKFAKIRNEGVSRDPNVNLDIGQTLLIADWQKTGNGAYSTRAMYRGAMWDVDLLPGSTAMPGQFVIHEVRGSRLIVTNVAISNH